MVYEWFNRFRISKCRIMELYVIKQLNNTFKLAHDSDYEKAKKIKPNEILKVSMTV